MKKSILVVLGILFYFAINGYAPDYVGDITGTVPRNGQLMKNDGTLVNESDSVYILQTTQNLTTGALNYTTSFDSTIKILEVEIKFDVAVTETVTITKVFTDTDYNTVRKSENLTANSSFVFNDSIYLNSDSELNVNCTNATATTNARLTITYSKLER